MCIAEETAPICRPGSRIYYHPPAAEEEAEPEQAEASVPEPPDAVVPAAPLVQEGRDVGERGRGSHRLYSSPRLGAHGQRPQEAPRFPRAPERWRESGRLTHVGRAPGICDPRWLRAKAPAPHDHRDRAYEDTDRHHAWPARAEPMRAASLGPNTVRVIGSGALAARCCAPGGMMPRPVQ